MISLCPACKTEQMVTAIALQENRGIVRCEICAGTFKPRAHRVTPQRERAFKQRLKNLQQEMATITSPAASTPPPSAQSSDGGKRSATEADRVAGDTTRIESASVAKATQRLMEELGRSVATLNKQLSTRIDDAASYIKQVKSVQKSGHALPSGQVSPETNVETKLPESRVDPKQLTEATASLTNFTSTHSSQIMQNSSQEKPAIAPNFSVADSANIQREEDKMNNATQAPANDKVQQQRMRKARQVIARQKLLLEYEKLKLDNEKLELEKKKLELEKVKFEILAKRKVLEDKQVDPFGAKGPALDGRPVVEYDIKTDLLPRTPNALDHGSMPTEKRREKIRLELLPSEPKTLYRKNLASKSKNFKVK